MPSMPKTEQGFGAMTQHQQAELAGVAVAASARAEVESAYILALRNPRNEDDSRARILQVCKNLKFAEVAKYRKPVGKIKKGNDWVQNYIEGPSIRFAEEAMRLWRNVKTLQNTIYDDPYKRIVKITVIDLESNLSYSKEFVIEKTVERKSAVGREVIGERINSYGEKISIVVATEDEILNKEAALASKTIRNNGLRLIPDHIMNEAMEIIEATIKSGVDQDPQKAKRNVIDNFAKLNILPKQLEEFLGHPLDIINPSEIVDLKKIYTTIAEGNATWPEIMEGRPQEAKNPETARLQDETEWEYEDRVKNTQQTQNGIFKPGDPATHQDVKSGQKKQ